MPYGLVEYLTEALNRRALLKKMAQAAGATGLALMGIREASATFPVQCCSLCLDPAGCIYGGCTCEWCWTCCNVGTDLCMYACYECYSASGSWCDNRTSPGGCPCGVGSACTCKSTGTTGCSNIICSKAVFISCPPPPPPPPPPFGCFWPCTTPIIFDIGGQGFHLTDADNGVLFDIRGTGEPVQIAWTAPGAGNAFLVLPGSDGLVHDGTQLFGNFTPQPPTADPNGFAALAVYDDLANGGSGDGVIDSRDAIFSSLRLWIDANHDGVCTADELHTLPSLGVNSVSLRYHISRREDRYGNIFRYRAAVNGGDPGESPAGPKTYDVILLHH